MYWSWQAEFISDVNTANGFVSTDDAFSAKLREETDEVMAAIGKDEHGNLPGINHLTEELADVVIVIMFYAAQHGLPIAEAIEAKTEYNRGRGYKHGKEF